MDSIKDRVSKGIEWINEDWKGETPWFWVVDPEILNIANTRECVIGQLHQPGSFYDWIGIRASVGYDEAIDFAHDHGFDDRLGDYDSLREEWCMRIGELRSSQ